MRMSPEEQLTVMETLTDVAAGHSEEPRRLALICLVGFGNDGIIRIVDLIDNLNADLDSRADAAHALAKAFSEGKVENSATIKSAIAALEGSLARGDSQLCNAAVAALGEIGPQAIGAKPALMELLDAKRGEYHLVVAIAAALL